MLARHISFGPFPLMVSVSRGGWNTKLSTFHLWQKNTLRHRCEAPCHRDSRKRQNWGAWIGGWPKLPPLFGVWGKTVAVVQGARQ